MVWNVDYHRTSCASSLPSRSVPMRVQMNYPSHPCIRIKHINLPVTDLFSDSVFYLSERINGLTSRRNKPSAETMNKRNRAIRLVIQGLYQCYCSMNEQSALLSTLIERHGLIIFPNSFVRNRQIVKTGSSCGVI